ncbi:HAMP domain-containing protein [Streptomyces boninensis]|uniref:HAMP domain-containing protein n=1 Tax=Streptomyces boninensis TaxID=2039455 RepID=UPI003B21F5BF
MAVSPEQQTPRGRRRELPLLGGVRLPIALLAVLLLGVCGITAATVGEADDGPVSQAVLDAQQFIAEDGAGTVGSALGQHLQDLPRAARLYGAGPGPVESPRRAVEAIAGSYQKWRGLALVEPATGRRVAVAGERVPVGGPLMPVPRARITPLADGEARLVTYAAFGRAGEPARVLVASGALRLPPDGKGRTTFVTGPGGRVLAASGERWADPGLRKLVAGAVAGAGVGKRAVARVDGAGRHVVLGSARVGEGAEGGEGGEGGEVAGFGLTVTTAVDLPPGTGAVGRVRLAVMAALSLLVVAVAVTLLLLWGVQLPVLRLQAESRRLVRGEREAPVRVRGWGEPGRMGVALEGVRRELRGEAREEARGEARGGELPVHGRQMRLTRISSVRAAAVLSAALVAGWAVALPLLNHADADDRVRELAAREQLARDQAYRTHTTAERVRRLVLEASADLSSLAPSVRTSSYEAGELLEEAVAGGGPWRSLYVLDRGGRVLARAGHAPTAYRWPAVLPRQAAVLQLNHSGKVPATAAVAPLGGGPVLVGELRPSVLSAPLERQGIGRAWLVDARERVIGGNRGFTAFEPLPGRGLFSAFTEWSTDSSLGDLLRGADAPVLAADGPLTGPGPVAELGWRVVTEKPLSWAALAAYERERGCQVVGLLALTAALLCTGWLHLVVLRPLRAAEAAASALAEGERAEVLYPRHEDEVGAIMRNLELLRRELKNPPLEQSPPSRGPRPFQAIDSPRQPPDFSTAKTNPPGHPTQPPEPAHPTS